MTEMKTCSRCEVTCAPYYSTAGLLVQVPDSQDAFIFGVDKGYQTHLCHMCWLRQHVCLDCKWNTHVIREYYRVHDTLWSQAVPNGCGMLCVGCLESRIGRELMPTDFDLDVPINHNSSMWPKSDRLMQRLGYLVDN